MRKYIYKVYYANETINCEKCPVIYENSEYIYFKRHSSNRLGCEDIRRCKQTVYDIEQRFNSIFINHIVFEQPTKEDLESLKEKINEAQKQRDINILNCKIKMINEQLKSYQNELDTLLNQ